MPCLFPCLARSPEILRKAGDDIHDPPGFGLTQVPGSDLAHFRQRLGLRLYGFLQRLVDSAALGFQGGVLHELLIDQPVSLTDLIQ